MTSIPKPSLILQHRPGVWVKESWLKFSGLVLQTRMVVLRAENGLLLYSPTPVDERGEVDGATLAELAELGDVRWLLAPNEIHNIGLKGFQSAFPEAHTSACMGHPRRVEGVRFDAILKPDDPSSAVPWTHTDELAFHVIGGNALLHEVAVLHKPSRTLVLTDAVEYIDVDTHLARPPGAAMRWMLRRSGLRFGEPCMSPEHVLLCEDPDALAESLAVLMSWDFDSLIISHGRIVEGESARTALETAFARNIAAARKRWKLSVGLWKLISRFA